MLLLKLLASLISWESHFSFLGEAIFLLILDVDVAVFLVVFDHILGFNTFSGTWSSLIDDALDSSFSFSKG